MKATIAGYLCLIAMVYCCWMVHRAQKSYFPLNSADKVQVTVTVTGPDGKIIEPIARDPGVPEPTN